MEPLVTLLAWAVVSYGAIVLLVALFQRRLMYFPSSSAPPPEGADFAELREIDLTSEDGTRLRAWHWPGTRALTLVIFHGNAGSRAHRLPWLMLLRRLDAGLFILDYRGYGGSEGRPFEAGLYADARAAVAWLDERAAGSLVFVGESLGCAVALATARTHPPAALILHAAFTSATDVARRAYPYLPVRWLLRDRYECRPLAEAVRVPVLFVHGGRDAIVPPRLGRGLFSVVPGDKAWYEIPDGDHNGLPFAGGPEYIDTLERFLATHVKRDDRDRGPTGRES